VREEKREDFIQYISWSHTHYLVVTCSFSSHFKSSFLSDIYVCVCVCVCPCTCPLETVIWDGCRNSSLGRCEDSTRCFYSPCAGRRTTHSAPNSPHKAAQDNEPAPPRGSLYPRGSFEVCRAGPVLDDVDVLDFLAGELGPGLPRLRLCCNLCVEDEERKGREGEEGEEGEEAEEEEEEKEEEEEAIEEEEEAIEKERFCLLCAAGLCKRGGL
jgi:hypothetical protein